MNVIENPQNVHVRSSCDQAEIMERKEKVIIYRNRSVSLYLDHFNITGQKRNLLFTFSLKNRNFTFPCVLNKNIIRPINCTEFDTNFSKRSFPKHLFQFYCA